MGRQINPSEVEDAPSGNGPIKGSRESQYYPKPKPYSNSMSEDELVTKNFLAIVQNKVDGGQLRLPKGSEERNILEEVIVYPGFYAGTLFGLTQFFVMRRAPSYFMKWNWQRMQKNKEIVTQYDPQKHAYKETLWAKPFSILFDGFFSCISGLSVWMIFMDKQKVFNTAADIPLMKGKSMISDTLCTDFLDEHKRIRPDFWRDYKDDSLTAIQTFVLNCKKRKVYEKQIQKEMNMTTINDEMEDIIPSLPTKVPDDILLTEPNDENESDDWASIEAFEEEEEGFPSNNDEFWSGYGRK